MFDFVGLGGGLVDEGDGVEVEFYCGGDVGGEGVGELEEVEVVEI